MDSGHLNRGKKQCKKPLMGTLITGRVIRVGRLIGDQLIISNYNNNFFKIIQL